MGRPARARSAAGVSRYHGTALAYGGGLMMNCSNESSAKILAVAVDFGDNLSGHNPSPKRMYTPDEVIHMTQYFHDLGVRRLYWFHNAHDALFEKPFGGSDSLLSFACDAAHDRGMTVLSVIKPFETGLQVRSIPPHLTPPVRAVKTNQGWHVCASRFAADHPEMRLKFRPKDTQPPGSGIIRRIRLVNQDNNGASLRPEDIEILWSEINSRFHVYNGPKTCEALTEEGGTGSQRIMEWSGLDMPREARYILLRYRGEEGAGNFANAPEELLQLCDETGRLTSQPDQGLVPTSRHLFLTGDLLLPEDTKAVLEDSEECAKAFENHFLFESRHRPRVLRVVNQRGGYICHSLDFNTHVAGALHPGYPEVRQYWLGWVQASLDAGVDGVALRIANHSSWCNRGEDAGFNQPALDEYARRTGAKADPATADLNLIRAINGGFYTQFVQECSAMIRRRNKRLEHFIHPIMDGLRENLFNNVPAAFDFPYRQWLRAGWLDGLCLRPHFDDMGKVKRFGDMIGAQARLFNVGMFYANHNGVLNRAASDNQVPEHFSDELRHVCDSDLFDGFILYEAAGVMGIDEDGRFHTSAKLETCIRECWRHGLFLGTGD